MHFLHFASNNYMMSLFEWETVLRFGFVDKCRPP